ncbi:DUF3515 domain-containing protein [Corynebacterium epidermidicanis]|uniref:Putative DUF3515 family protein n=1 Tax=Corynebacterium epidermidicanis TaxID=1050174 RepID=A0A0G3GQY0_9CORY|nr:DUF3515 domain-containing protein [Corynebacterium epidermidicanis]AKK02980.1 putative DUF3515 family protein [Corynebacterium epidermidicanis]
MSTPEDIQFNRVPLIVALVLSLALVIGVLTGAKLLAGNAAKQPVALSALPAPDADSAECARFVEALPDSLLKVSRAKLADPVQPGTAAYSAGPSKRITLRCGVETPLQYTELSQTRLVDGVEWLPVVDNTPGSTLQTWFSVNTHPIVAVTTDAEVLGERDMPVQELGKAVRDFTGASAKPNPVPLTQLAAPTATDPQCAALLLALPENLGEAYRRTRDVALSAATAAWVAPGMEPVVLRCGVADPAGYAPGARLSQINDVPWFEDTTVANGTTSGTMYALGREVNVAVSLPSNAGNAAMVSLTEAISANTKPRG